MPESSLDIKDIPGDSFKYRVSALRRFSRPSLLSLPMHRSPYLLSAFCTEENVPECLSYVNQELSTFGLAPVSTESEGSSELNVVAVLNSTYDLIQLQRRGLRALEDMEVEQVKSNSNTDYLQLSNTRLKDQLEVLKRENTGLLERERQLHLKVKSLQNCLKNEKEEMQKLQNIIASRASQYNHDMKRREREFNKLKERLNQLLINKKEKKQAIDVLNYIGRADGKRSLWKTGKTEAKHEGEMYKSLLSDYDSRQKELVLENAELKKVLQQMKRDMVSILRSRNQTMKGVSNHDDGEVQADSDEEEEVFDSSKDSLELSCVHAREKLTNSIRLQWRRLKSHVERLDSQGSTRQGAVPLNPYTSLVHMGERANIDAILRETHEEEMDRLKLEIQQCKDFIHTQQQLLQQQLSSPCDEEMPSLLNDGYMVKEKERLKEEWKTLGEQRKNFEKERRNFTEAAIRLSHERKAFEEDRATWLKYQFLNLTPFADPKKPTMSKSKSAFSISEPEVRAVSTPEKLNKTQSHATFSTPGCAPVKTPSTADLYRTLHFIPKNSQSTTKPKRRDSYVQESSVCCNGDAPTQRKLWNDGEDHRIYTLKGEKNGSI